MDVEARMFIPSEIIWWAVKRVHARWERLGAIVSVVGSFCTAQFHTGEDT
jgi:hypothetical protein